MPHDVMVQMLHDPWFYVMAIVQLAILFTAGILPCILILRKAGYSGWLMLWWLVPIANFVALWKFALAKWPNLKEQN